MPAPEPLSTTPSGMPGAPYPDAGATARVRAALLEQAGRPLVIFHEGSRALDPQALAREFGRDLQPASEATRRRYVETLLRRHGQGGETAAPPRALPTHPADHDAELIVDPGLLEARQLGMNRGFPEAEWQTVDQDALRRSFEQVRRFDCTRAIQPDTCDPTDFAADRSRLDESVANLTARRVGARLDEALNIPPLPETARRIVQLQLVPDYDLSDLTGVIESDPALAAQVIGWANSSLYNAPGQVESIDDAIMRVLGFDLVLNLALGLSVSKTLRVPKSEPEFTYDFWQRSVYTAALVESLARAAKRPMTGLAYLAGLLHDFGYLVLAHAFPPYFDELLLVRGLNDHLPSKDLEHTWLGLSSAQIASHLLDNWSLPAPVVNAVRRQDDPATLDDGRDYADLLHLGKRVLAEAGVLRMPAFGPLPENTYDAIGVEQATVTGMRDLVLDAYEDMQPLCQALNGR